MSALPPPSDTPSETTSTARPVARASPCSSADAPASTRSPASPRAACWPAIDPEKYDVVPIGIADRRPVGARVGRRRHRALTIAPTTLPRGRRRRPTLVLDQDGGASSRRPRAGRGAAGARARSTWSSRCCTGRSARTAPSRGCWSSPTCRYVGSGVLASAVGMDKHYMKVVLESAGLPMLPYAVVTDRAWRTDPRAACRDGGRRARLSRSSSSPAGAAPASASARSTPRERARRRRRGGARWDPKVVVEASAGAGAREVECGVLDTLGRRAGRGERAGRDHRRRRPRLLRLRREVPPRGGDPARRARRPRRRGRRRGRRLAVAAFEALSCEGLARVDFFLLADGRLVVNEINTMPGFTPTSMFPRMWAASGLDYPALVDRLLAARAAPAHRPALSGRPGLRRSGRAPALSPRPVRTGRPAPPRVGSTPPRGSPRRPRPLDHAERPPRAPRGSTRSSPGKNQSTPLTRQHSDARSNSSGGGPPQRSTIAGSPQAAASRRGRSPRGGAGRRGSSGRSASRAAQASAWGAARSPAVGASTSTGAQAGAGSAGSTRRRTPGCDARRAARRRDSARVRPERSADARSEAGRLRCGRPGRSASG